MCLEYLRDLKSRYFASMCSNMSKKYGGVVLVQKHKMFQHLNEVLEERQKNAGGNPDAQPLFTLLEVGGGSGVNFEHVTSPVKWTVVEPNVRFAPYFNDNVKSQTGEVIHQVDLVEAFGEDMSVFPDNSFDAVVITQVLCSVTSVERCLDEVKRLLKPGGNFYFMEHVIDHSDSWLRTLQNVLTRTNIWPFFGDGCNLNRDTAQYITQSGFGNVEMERFIFSNLLKFRPMSPHIMGRATKKIQL